MNRASLLALAFAAFVTGCATSPEPPAAQQVTADGLVGVRSGRVDQLYLRPGGEIAAYSRVLLEPVAVQLSTDWVRQQHGNNYRIEPTYPRYKDADEVTRETAESVAASLARAFRASGFELVEMPGPGVMRISAKVSDLYINAPDIVSPGYARNLTREAGDAYLSLEARDAVDGKPLARVQHHAIARETPRGSLANDPANALWMDTLYQRWAENCVAEIGLARGQRASLR